MECGFMFSGAHITFISENWKIVLNIIIVLGTH
jgi:hypothetical protein